VTPAVERHVPSANGEGGITIRRLEGMVEINIAGPRRAAHFTMMFDELLDIVASLKEGR